MAYANHTKGYVGWGGGGNTIKMACLLSHSTAQAEVGHFTLWLLTPCVCGWGGNLCLHVKLVASNVFLLFCRVCPLAMLCWLSKQRCAYTSSDSSALTPLPFVAPEMCKAFIKGGLFVLNSLQQGKLGHIYAGR